MAKPDPERLDAWRSIASLHSRVSMELDAALRVERDLTLALFEVLDALVTNGGRMGTGDLAVQLGANASSLTRRLDRLEEEDWVARTRVAGDARSITVGVTREGRDVYRAASVTWRRTLSEHFTAYLTDTDVGAIARVTSKLTP